MGADDASPRKKFVIIGAGPTGLGAAIRLLQHGIDDFVIVDEAPYAGGLSRSVTDAKGFVWDMGGHVIFSHYKFFSDLLDAAVDDWNLHERESWVWVSSVQRWVPYPFQSNIHRLPADNQKACLEGLEVAKQKKENNAYDGPTVTFQDWITRNFGDGISDVFMAPYNYKVWAFPPCDMSAGWMGERVPTIDIDRIKENIKLGRDEKGWGPNAQFRYPVRGGTGAIWQNVVERFIPKSCVKLSRRVQTVDTDKKSILLVGGETLNYDYLISTMPLDLLVDNCLSGSSTEELKTTTKAHTPLYSSSHIIGLGFSGTPPDHLKGKCWIYFPGDDCPFYRATLFSHYSKHNVPDPENQWSLMFEVSESVKKPESEANMIEQTIQGALNTHLIKSRDEVVSTWNIRLEHGYPTPFLERDAWVSKVHPVLMEKGIWSRGRFGGWKYEAGNQDHSLMQGVEAVDNILLGLEEVTYMNPNKANTCKFDTKAFFEPATKFDSETSRRDALFLPQDN